MHRFLHALLALLDGELRAGLNRQEAVEVAVRRYLHAQGDIVRVGLRGALRGGVGDGHLERLLCRDIGQRGGDVRALRVDRPREVAPLGGLVGKVGGDGAAPQLDARGRGGRGVLDLDHLHQGSSALHGPPLDPVADLERLEGGRVGCVVARGRGGGDGRKGGGHHSDDDGGDLHGYICTYVGCVCGPGMS